MLPYDRISVDEEERLLHLDATKTEIEQAQRVELDDWPETSRLQSVK